MSERTLYTCDRCKFERPAVGHYRPFVHLDGYQPSVSLSDLCAQCVMEFLAWVDAGKSARQKEEEK